MDDIQEGPSGSEESLGVQEVLGLEERLAVVEKAQVGTEREGRGGAAALLARLAVSGQSVSARGEVRRPEHVHPVDQAEVLPDGIVARAEDIGRHEERGLGVPGVLGARRDTRPGREDDEDRAPARPRRAGGALFLGGLALALLGPACAEWPDKGYLRRYEPPLHIAHRGGRAELPEHTLYAYDFALNHHGTDILEVDVRRTLDGHLVIVHDESLTRLVGVDARVADVSLRYLRSLRVPIPRPLNAAALTPTERMPIADERLLRVPTLGEVIRRYPGCLLNIEIKDAAVTDDLIAFLRESDRRGEVAVDQDVCFAGFDDHVVRTMQLAFPTSCHTYGTLAAACVVVPRALPGILQIETRNCPEYDLFALPDRVLTEGVIASIHRTRRQVYAWTVDDKDRMRQLLDWGVDGIMTDRPAVLREVFAERNLPTRQMREAGNPRRCAIVPERFFEE